MKANSFGRDSLRIAWIGQSAAKLRTGERSTTKCPQVRDSGRLRVKADEDIVCAALRDAGVQKHRHGVTNRAEHNRIKSFYWSNGGIGIKAYIEGKGDYATKYESNNCPDTSANGFYEYCRKHSPKKYWTNISDMPDIPGIAVFMPGHVGLYVGGGYVVEARGFAYGVVKTRLNDRPWKTAAMLPDDMLEYVDIGDVDKPANETKLGDRLLKRGVKGSDVKELQQKLIKLGYDVGKWQDDGEYGSATVNAVKAFQRDHKLSADGMYGPKTHKVMMAL